MSAKNGQRRSFTEEFKRNAVDLIVNQGYTFAAASRAVNVDTTTLRDWHRKFAPIPKPSDDNASVEQLTAEVKRLRKELARVEMEREILKKSDGVFRERVAVKYAWIKNNKDIFPIVAMCRVLGAVRVASTGGARPCQVRANNDKSEFTTLFSKYIKNHTATMEATRYRND